jgi:hypothetical protein
MKNLGLGLLVTGCLLAVLGAVLLAAGKFSFPGRLPGDLHIQGKHTSIFLPLTTCILLSVLLTVLLNVVLRIFHR